MRDACEMTTPTTKLPWWHWLAITLALLLAGASSAAAQMGGAQMGGHGGRHRGQQQATQSATAAPSLIPAAPAAWPRLDVGAILCQSRDDLIHYQARGTADAAPGPAPDCHVIEQPTGITILDRDGPSRTHVALTDSPDHTGWTDVYLPSTPPPS